MVDTNLSESITEILEILKNMNKEYTEKLPKKFLEFLKENQSDSYTVNFDDSKNLKNTNLHKETRKLLAIMYLNYWSNENEKKDYLQVLNNNQQKHDEEIKLKYNPDNLFKNNQQIIEKVDEIPENNTQLMQYKEGIIKRFINRIKLFFRKK